jgi:hypothetical protein
MFLDAIELQQSFKIVYIQDYMYPMMACFIKHNCYCRISFVILKIYKY